jgi:hypothetical protein
MEKVRWQKLVLKFSIYFGIAVFFVWIEANYQSPEKVTSKLELVIKALMMAVFFTLLFEVVLFKGGSKMKKANHEPINHE